MSRSDDERLADLLDAADELAGIVDRGRSAHHYHRVDPGQVWNIAAEHVPAMAAALRSE